jgi:hypothetical protein
MNWRVTDEGSMKREKKSDRGTQLNCEEFSDLNLFGQGLNMILARASETSSRLRDVTLFSLFCGAFVKCLRSEVGMSWIGSRN